MKLYTCINHPGHWPVPTATIILAESNGEARAMIDQSLREAHIRMDDWKLSDYKLVEVDMSIKQAIVLSDGDY